MQEPATTADEEIRAANELYSQGNLPAAELHCRRGLALAPRHSGGQMLLGVVLHLEGRYTEAEEVFGELALQQPDQPGHWINLGNARRGAKRYTEALTAFTRAAQLGAASAAFFYNVGLTHFERSDFESARGVFEKAATLEPRDVEFRYRYAEACYECRRPVMALRALEGWEHLPDISAEVAANVGNLLLNLGESARGERALAEAARDPNPNPSVTLTLIHAYERINRLSDARALLDRLRRDPRSRGLGSDLTSIQAQIAEREGDYETAVQLLQHELQRVGDFPQRHFLLFRLAKALDGLKGYEEAFAALVEAHRSQLAHFAQTDPAVTLRGVPTMEVTKYSCDPVDVATWDHSGAPSLEQSPVFIVAFPRSGTTLLELTLDAHPLLRSMDERPFIQNALDEIVALGIRYPEQLGRLSNAQLDQIRASYWGRVEQKVRLEAGQRLVDKNPLNLLRLPVIRRLFPHARILFAIRHPCDVLLSCYMQHFRAPDFALLCADLRTLAVGYRRGMDFWYQQAELLQPQVREVFYERFVSDFDPQVRAISDFLQVPWDEGMLAPASHARSKGFISTPSYSQVVQPVNRKAVDRWRHYERHFATIIPELQPSLQRWGYSAA